MLTDFENSFTIGKSYKLSKNIILLAIS